MEQKRAEELRREPYLPDQPSNGGFMNLHYAVAQGDFEATKLLLCSKSVDVDELSYIGTAVHLAAATGNERVLLLLLQHRANLKIRANNLTPLSLALLAPSPKCVKLLMEAGAEIDDIRPVPPAMLSANNGLTDCMIRLLEGGADLNVLYNADAPGNVVMIPLPMCSRNSCHKVARFAVGCCGHTYCTVQHLFENHPNSHIIGVAKVFVCPELNLDAEVPGCVHPSCPPWWLQKAMHRGNKIIYEYRSSDDTVGDQMVHSYTPGQNEPVVEFGCSST